MTKDVYFYVAPAMHARISPCMLAIYAWNRTRGCSANATGEIADIVVFATLTSDLGAEGA